MPPHAVHAGREAQSAATSRPRSPSCAAARRYSISPPGPAPGLVAGPCVLSTERLWPSESAGGQEAGRRCSNLGMERGPEGASAPLPTELPRPSRARWALWSVPADLGHGQGKGSGEGRAWGPSPTQTHSVTWGRLLTVLMPGILF